MRIISDITGKSYDTVDECLEAEKKHNEELPPLYHFFDL